MKCPSCSAETPDGSADCHACGVNFAKWQAKMERRAAEAPPPAADPAPKPARSGVYAAVALAVVAGAAAGGWALYARSMQAAAGDDGKAIYDPAPYRAQIYALEGTLYQDGSPSKDETSALSNLGIQIAGLLQDEHAQNPYVHEAVNDLMRFASQVSDDASEGKLAAGSRQAWIASWEALRAKRFARARWFHAAARKG